MLRSRRSGDGSEDSSAACSPVRKDSETIVPASFRDPAGFVWTEGGLLYRQVNEYYRDHYDHLIRSGLYDALVRDRLLIPHEEVPSVPPGPDGYKVLRPERVGFISYPYEWCFSQLRDAALLTLEVQERAMDFGMSLRDASAFNVQFHLGRPVLIDTLSFEILEEGKPWIAYRQYCQHFLAPLALMAYCDVRLGSLLRLYIDGVPLDLATTLLPRRTRLRPSLQLHLHAHARSQKRYEARDPSEKLARRRFSVHALKGLVASLRRATGRLSTDSDGSHWSRYYEHADHYAERGLDYKRQIVGRLLELTGGSTVWDLGANVGVMSREGSRRGMDVICFEMDPACVEANYRRAREEDDARILPLVCDLTNPTPGTGWANTERSSLRDRGPADVVMALALIHHLAIGNNVPLDRIVGFLAEIGRWVIVEFVPKSDPMVQELLRTRADVFPGYAEEVFERALSEVFMIERCDPIQETGRKLFLARAKT